MALGQKGDVLICISTSGNSENINLAAKSAKSLGLVTLGFLGNQGGDKNICDYSTNYSEHQYCKNTRMSYYFRSFSYGIFRR